MKTLTDDERRVTRGRIGLAYLNFDMANHMCVLHSLRDEYGNRPHVQATVCLRGGSINMVIKGEASGFFATPIIQLAIVDIRSSIEFFGLRFDVRTGTFVAEPPTGDDVCIGDFVSPSVTVADFLSGRGKPEFTNVEANLKKVIYWSNKRIAHFTQLIPDVTLEEIRDSCLFMRFAYETHFYTPQGLPFPVPGSPL